MNFPTVAAVPRVAQRILESLGAGTDFCEMVVGDMAEEFAIRSAWDGSRAARYWYYREGMRVAPYLLRDWCRRLRRKDAVRLVPAALLASAFGIAFEHLMLASIQLVVTMSGAGHGALMRSSFGASVIHPALMLLWTLTDGVATGYVAAWIGRRAPLPTAVLLAGVWLSAIAAVNIAGGQLGFAAVAPLWFKVVNVTALVGGVLVGGVVRSLGARGTVG